MPEVIFTTLVRLASTRIVLWAQHQKFPLKIRGCTKGKIVATFNVAATHQESAHRWSSGTPALPPWRLFKHLKCEQFWLILVYFCVWFYCLILQKPNLGQRPPQTRMKSLSVSFITETNVNESRLRVNPG